MLGALNCIKATRACALDFFVLYSSATTLFGNPGQAAYVAANLWRWRRSPRTARLGLPVTCIGWGPIADAGYLARNERVLEALVGRMGGEALQAPTTLPRARAHARIAAPRQLGLIDLDWATLEPLPAGCAGAEILGSGALAARGDRGECMGDSAQELRRRLGTHRR
jgi:phthiocerol/phenolphthiocerol synthesis type-I polyketide synthase C